jgi:hypothetical protein
MYRCFRLDKRCFDVCGATNMVIRGENLLNNKLVSKESFNSPKIKDI